MKLNEIKRGQYFKFLNNELIEGHKFLCLDDSGNVVNLTTLELKNFKFGMGDADVELVDNKANIYHACRQAFVCGQERVPWHMTLHAIREGLGMEDVKTYNLKEKDYENHSQLRELVSWLKQSLSASNVDNTK